MSIVAHQFNILSEQLRKGIGGLNEGRKQASESALKMEQLKYGIEKDRRSEARADATSERAERSLKMQEETFKYKEAEYQHNQREALARMKAEDALRFAPFDAESMRDEIDPLRTLDDDKYNADFSDAVKEAGVTDKLGAVNSGIFRMKIINMTNEKHRKDSLKKLKVMVSQYEEAAKEGNMTDEDDQIYEQTKAGIKTLQKAIDDPLAAAKQKMNALMNLHSQITDPRELDKAQFEINKQQKRIDQLQSEATSKATSGRIVKSYGEVNPYTGESDVTEHVVPKGQAFMPPQGRTLDKPKTEMKVIDVSNKPKLDTAKLKAERAFSWAEKAAGMSELEYNNLLSSGALPAEIKAYGKVSNVDQLLSIINEQKVEIDKAIKLNGMGLNNKAIYEYAKEFGKTYEEMFEWLAMNADNIRE
jgi:hypothetical protein